MGIGFSFPQKVKVINYNKRLGHLREMGKAICAPTHTCSVLGATQCPTPRTLPPQMSGLCTTAPIYSTQPALSQVLLQVHLLALGSLKPWSEETVSSGARRKRRKIGKRQKNLKDSL